MCKRRNCRRHEEGKEPGPRGFARAPRALPPTPISGFGEKSMEAIFNTPENPFIYYLLTDINGKMTFTDNYEEFINLKNKAKDEGVIP